jgi:hypothetical protein
VDGQGRWIGFAIFAWFAGVPAPASNLCDVFALFRAEFHTGQINLFQLLLAGSND